MFFLRVSTTLLTAYLGGDDHVEMDMVRVDSNGNILPGWIVFVHLLEFETKVLPHPGYQNFPPIPSNPDQMILRFIDRMSGFPDLHTPSVRIPVRENTGKCSHPRLDRRGFPAGLKISYLEAACIFSLHLLKVLGRLTCYWLKEIQYKKWLINMKIYIALKE